MPRDEYLIQTFDKGIISSADQSDIENGAAAWSIDENPESIPGTIQPRLTDTVQIENTSNQYCIEKHSWITREDGKRDLIFYNAKGGTIDALSDFNGTPAYTTVDSNTIDTGKTIAMATVNRAVRIGQGNAASKYVGYIDQGQFGNPAPTALQYDNAELIPPSSFPAPYKTIADATYLYGIEWQGTKILKIAVADGTVTKSSGTFNSLQGICDCDIDATYFYLFDAIGKYGNLYKIKKSDLTIYETYHVTGWDVVATQFNTTSGSYISDIETTTNKLWFSVWKSGGWTLEKGGKAIYNIALSSLTANADIVPTDVTFTYSIPTRTGYSIAYPALYVTDPANWFLSVAQFYAGSFATTSTYWSKPSKRTFVKTSTATEIGWLGDIGLLTRAVYVGVSIQHWYYTDLNSLRYGGRGIIIMNESSAKDALLNSTNTRFRSLDTGVTTSTEDTTDLLYTDGIKLVGSVKEDYLFTRESTGTLDIYFSDGTAEFKLSDAVWDVTDVYDDVITLRAVYIDSGYDDETYNKIEEYTWRDYIPQTEEAKSTIASLTNVTVSTSDTSGADKDVTVNILSSVSGSGKFLTRVYDTTAFSGITNTYVGINPVTVTITPTTNTEGTFDITKEYFYKVAFEYDLYQMSPLSENASNNHLTQATDTMDVSIDIYESASISERVTAVLIFRAEAGALNKGNPETLYRLAGRISTKDNWVSDITDEGTWGTKKSYSFTDLGSYGPSYETETGCPETLPNNTMNYTISCTGAGYLFVGQGYNNELEKVSNLIFRSKKNAPDTFDWSNDFCVLPTMPIGLHYFKGYLYAFDNSKMYVIDAEALVLVGEYDGFGISNSLAICSNEDAMYFANVDNIYMHDGKTPSIISYPINQIGTNISGATSHRTLASDRTIVMKISPKYNSLVIAYMKYSATLDTYTPMFVYHLTGRKWFYWLSANTAGTYIDYTTADKRSLIVDYLGNIYLSVYKGIAKLCGSSNGATCTWYSKLINFGDNTTLKKIYKVIWDGTCDGYIGYNTPSTITTQLTSGSYINTTKYLTTQLKFTITSGEILRGITVLYRKMLGLR
jgi:hypothetical protein